MSTVDNALILPPTPFHSTNLLPHAQTRLLRQPVNFHTQINAYTNLNRLFSTSSPGFSPKPLPKPPVTELTHLTKSSEIHVVPISSKSVTTRHATAVGYVSFCSSEVLSRIQSAALRKGDVLAVARVAGIQAAKRTSDLVPLCHSGVQLEGVRCWVEAVDAIHTREQKEHHEKADEKEWNGEEVEDGKLQDYLSKPVGPFGGIRLAATVSCTGKTGVEMEALCAVAGAGLCVLDMVKGVDRGATLEGIQNVRKSGGRSGEWWKEGWEAETP